MRFLADMDCISLYLRIRKHILVEIIKIIVQAQQQINAFIQNNCL